MSLGLVLSGGAAYGLANAGVLRVLEREGIRPDVIAGSSMGAIVGALYAFKGTTDAFDPLIATLKLSQIARLSKTPFKGGLHGGLLRQNLEHLLGTLLGDACIGDCKIPFLCVAAHVTAPIDWTGVLRPGFAQSMLQHATLHVFSQETRLMDAIMASSAIPVLFSPVEINGEQFVDLVHFGSIPARTLRTHFHPDIVVATDTNPRYLALEKVLPAPWIEFLQRGYKELEQSKAACDLLITPKMPAAVFRFDKATAFMDAGERAAEEALPRIRNLIAEQ